MEPPRITSSSPWDAESALPAAPPGWDDYREARERFLRTLQIDSLNRLMSRPDAEPARLRPGGAQ